MLDAVADAMPRAAPTAQQRAPVARPDFERTLRERLSRYTEPRPELPQLVRISLRVEADEEELVAGSVRLVLQVHDEQNPLHLCDAAVLWTEDGPRVRRSRSHPRRDRAARRRRGLAGARPAARAARARPDHARRRRAREPARGRRRCVGHPRRRRAVAAEPGSRPDRDHGAGPVPADVGARGTAADRDVRRGRPVQLPVAARAARRPADRGGDGAARAVGGPPAPAAWQLDRHRPVDRPQGAQARGPHREPDRGDRGGPDRRRAARHRRAPGRGAGAARRLPAPGPRAAAQRRPAGAGRGPARAAGHAARLPAPGADLAGRAHLPRTRRVPGRRHGARQDHHPDRPAPAPRGSGHWISFGARPSWSARPACSATGSRSSPGSHPTWTCAASTAVSGRSSG